MEKTIYHSLKAYCDSDAYPFHMPGHKRNPNSGALAEFYHLDITEIDGFDNLHQPGTLIKDAQQRAADLYHSEETFFLVNGSTSGILSAVSAIAGAADKLIVARNCHRAVYHAAFLNRMELYYVYPEIDRDYGLAGEINVRELERTIKDILQKEDLQKKESWQREVRQEKRLQKRELPKADLCGESPDTKGLGQIAGVVITSPTYDGIVSDVKAIADMVHSYGIPLIVDQAHGAHFGFHPGYPENAVSQGADIVIHSVHKTLPAPTQTALLHRNGKLVDSQRLKRYLRIYQSSSPSYLLMAGIDEAVTFVEREGFERLDELLKERKWFLEKLAFCKHIRVCPFTEPGKLVISVHPEIMTGQELYDSLREDYHLQMEMASGSYVLAIWTMMDTREGIRRLAEALCDIDEKIAERKSAGKNRIFLSEWETDVQPEKVTELWRAYEEPAEDVELSKAGGRICGEFVNLYPPGIPLLLPGERITDELAERLALYEKEGYTVQGIVDHKIKVLN